MYAENNLKNLFLRSRLLVVGGGGGVGGRVSACVHGCVCVYMCVGVCVCYGCTLVTQDSFTEAVLSFSLHTNGFWELDSGSQTYKAKRFIHGAI